MERKTDSGQETKPVSTGLEKLLRLFNDLIDAGKLRPQTPAEKKANEEEERADLAEIAALRKKFAPKHG